MNGKKIMQRFEQSVPGSLTHGNLSRVGGHMLGVKTQVLCHSICVCGKGIEPGMGYDLAILVSLTKFVHMIQN